MMVGAVPLELVPELAQRGLAIDQHELDPVHQGEALEVLSRHCMAEAGMARAAGENSRGLAGLEVALGTQRARATGSSAFTTSTSLGQCSIPAEDSVRARSGRSGGDGRP